MCAVGRICSWFAATLLLAGAVPAAGGPHLILSESTADALQLEPLQTLPDFTKISPGSVYELAASARPVKDPANGAASVA